MPPPAGLEALIVQNLLSKLRQLAQAATSGLPFVAADSNFLGRKVAMAPTSLLSLRPFPVAPASDTHEAGPSRYQQHRSHHASLPPASHHRQFPISRHGHDAWQALQHGRRQSSGVASGGGPPRRDMATAAAQVAQAQQEADAVHPGAIVHFKRSGAHLLGLVLRQSPAAHASWVIEDVTGTLFTVRDREVAYVLPGSEYGPFHLAAVAAAVAEQADPSLLALAWELSEAGALYTVPEMAELLYNSEEPAACAAAFSLLHGDRLYFKQAGRSPPMYAARGALEVADAERQSEGRRRATQLLQQFIEAADAAKALPRAQRPVRSDWLPGPHGERLAAVEAYALGRPPPPAAEAWRPDVVATLRALGVSPTPQGAAEMLQAVGFWPPHVQLGLLASGLTEEFEPALEAAAREAAASPPPDADAHCRLDLTALQVTTIDEESTTEIDDGLSAEALPGGGVRVWVHVADPTRWVQPGDALDAEARRRSKTLYLPTGMVPMFPLSLAEGPFSLREGHRCCALTVEAVVAEDGSMVPGSVKVGPSTILPTRRLTYDLADEMLAESSPQQEGALHALAAAAAARRRWRAAAGAVEIQMPEVQVEVVDPGDDDPAVSVQAGDPLGSLSRHLVAEMMIMAGEVAAKVGATMGVPLPYRGQPDPILPSEEAIQAVPPGPCRMSLLRACMTRSVTAADAPQRHAGLGLEAYAQVTSPIRRYGDLLAHWQLKAALRGAPLPLAAPAMAAALAELATTTQRASKLERDAQSYWVARYFRGRTAADPGATWAATFLGWFKMEAGLARVLLDSLGLESIVKVSRAAVPGTALLVQCTSADPLLGMYRLEEAAPGAAATPAPSGNSGGAVTPY